MKKFTKQVVLMLLSIALVVTLSGCDIVGSARRTQAFIQDTDGISTITYNNTEYRLLPESNSLSPLSTDYESLIYVTEPDVPVLLSYFLGDSYSISDDGIFIYSTYESSQGYFCRADKYDELVKLIEDEFNPTGLCYSYYYYDIKKDSYIEKRTMLTDEESTAIASVLTNTEGVLIPETAELSYDYLVEVYACSSDLLFMEHCTDIALVGSSYYLIVYTDGSKTSYKVPESEASIISKIVDIVIDSDEFFSDSFDEVF